MCPPKSIKVIYNMFCCSRPFYELVCIRVISCCIHLVTLYIFTFMYCYFMLGILIVKMENIPF